MRGSDHRFPLFAAIAVALLLAAVPVTAQASSPTENFDASTCMSNQQNAYTAYAQAQTTAQLKVWNNQTKPDMKKVFCWNNILNIFNAIGSATSNLGIFGAFIWSTIQGVITSALNSVCQAVVGAIQSAVNMLKNLLCIPLPSFGLSAGFSIGGFAGGTCGSGISLLNLGNSSAVRPMVPGGYSPLWNYSPQ